MVDKRYSFFSCAYTTSPVYSNWNVYATIHFSSFVWIAKALQFTFKSFNQVRVMESESNAEETPLILRKRLKIMKRRYHNASKYVTSKESLLTLLLNFAVHIIYYSFISPTHFFPVYPELLAILVNISTSAFLRCSYPCAGYLADNHFGRYRTVFGSLKFLKPGVMLVVVGGSLVVSAILYTNLLQRSVFIVLLSMGLIMLLPGFVLLLIGMIGFKANIIQFGLDQLFDSPWEDQVIYVYWFMWTSFCPRLIIQLLFRISKEVSHSKLVQFCSIGVALVIAGILIATLWWIATRHKNWFLISQSSFNPYRLVCLVTKFSMKHKVPVYRSALTYCEDKIPTGLDLGKSKYGGPFTTEQVEDVKVFYGLLKVLVAIGPVFTLCYLSDPMILVIQSHIQASVTNSEALSINSTSDWQKTREILLDVLDQIIVLLVIPVYLFCMRPLVSYYTPGVLKKIGLSMAVLLFALAVLVVIEMLIHLNYKNTGCIFSLKTYTNNESASITYKRELPVLVRYFKYISIVHRTVTNILVVTIHVAMYQFLCSQSPHAMKGLLIGVSYAIRACFDILGPALALLMGVVWHRFEGRNDYEINGNFLSCDMVFYCIAIILGVLFLLLYMYVAKNYKYRVRDEVCNVQQYVENYYYKYAGLMSRRRKRFVYTKMDLTTSGV